MALQRLTEPAATTAASPGAAGEVAVPNEPLRAFLSYTQIDDRRLKGALSQLRDKLQLAVWQLAGRQFQILQDKDGIAFRQHWPERLEDALLQTNVLVPILTPDYFDNRDCRAAALTFLDYEVAAQRSDLVLPIYLTEAPVLEDLQLRAEDSVAWRLRRRHMLDWRNLNLESHWDAEIEARIAELSQAIAGAAGPTSATEDHAADAELRQAAAEGSAQEQALVKALASKEAALRDFEKRLRKVEDQRVADKAAYFNERNELILWRRRFWFTVAALGGALVIVLASMLS